jgi:hypothetical protein
MEVDEDDEKKGEEVGEDDEDVDTDTAGNAGYVRPLPHPLCHRIKMGTGQSWSGRDLPSEVSSARNGAYQQS